MISFNNLGNYGRLGNQMFQYASLRGIAENMGFDFCIPPENVFGVNDTKVKNSISNIHNTFNISWVKKNISNNKVINESGFEFDEELFNNCEDNVDLIGYFQSEKYFKHIENDIRKDFSFDQNLVETCAKFLLDIDPSGEVISMHIRRKDYLDLQSYHPILSIEYYQEALNRFPDVPVIIFSDDHNWCSNQKIFDSDRFLISEKNTPDFDMCLMSTCKYHIIANSSFSWWSAWLSKSNNVVAPKNWFGPSLGHFNTKDLYLDVWEKI